MLDLSVKMCGLDFKNPISTASGTFSIKDSPQFYDPSQIGAIITKGVSSVAWLGNPTPRIAETYGGMLNSIGLENPGVDLFIEDELPILQKFDTRIIVNVAGKTLEDYCTVVEKLNETSVDMLEINISCPNVKSGGIAFGINTKLAGQLTKEVKRISTKPIIIKLSPNVTDITEIAKAVECEGADCVSLINTLLGMRIDVNQFQPVLKNKVGGFSGPAIKPVAIRMIYQVRRAIKLPIIGLGGIFNGEDVAEFLLAGADFVSVGTACFHNPLALINIKEDFTKYMEKHNFNNITELKLALLEN
ncbi:MAG: dihydroorotate dehydrogenase B catalytic subunit [Candidatus Epulonipiscioides saccharophilum]|nr:MAG: dihydroorotate dehydrogenase B catalytic subunit [Epulopiscium sp. AS2M-Bin001]